MLEVTITALVHYYMKYNNMLPWISRIWSQPKKWMTVCLSWLGVLIKD